MPDSFAQHDWRGDIMNMLPNRIAQAVAGLDVALAERTIELRLGENRPMLALDQRRDYYISPDGSVTFSPAGALSMEPDECRDFMDYITKFSAYAFADELRNGFLTLKGGYRVGIAGRTVVSNGMISGFGSCSSFCIRIPREVRGSAFDLSHRIRNGGRFHNTLIVSPPGVGKTTLLRDLARTLGTDSPSQPGMRIAVIDERSEISGGIGVRRFDVGAKTDVLDGCPKSQGILLALRSLNPQVIMTDEIGRPEDSSALEDAMNCGVGIVATAHGGGMEDILRRPVLRSMVESGLFHLYVVMDGSRGIGAVTEIIYGLNRGNGDHSSRKAGKEQ